MKNLNIKKQLRNITRNRLKHVANTRPVVGCGYCSLNPYSFNKFVKDFIKRKGGTLRLCPSCRIKFNKARVELFS